MYLAYYLEQLGYLNIPKFLLKYLEAPSLVRLKNIGYFCGMYYASKDIYHFKEYISRYDHSLTISLMTYKLTKDKKKTIAALFHDIATPCFSHVIDYMNEDYMSQESTEEYTEDIIKNDTYLLECLEKDHILLDDVIDFKKYTIVDIDRPKVCADRLDGIILNGFCWMQNIDKHDIKCIVDDMYVFLNEDQEEEIGFQTLSVARKVLEVSDSFNRYCHLKEDNYMMDLLARITKHAMEKEYITYKQLYIYDEKELFEILKSKKDKTLQALLFEFEHKKIEDIKNMEFPEIKQKALNPAVCGKRMKQI